MKRNAHLKRLLFRAAVALPVLAAGTAGASNATEVGTIQVSQSSVLVDTGQGIATGSAQEPMQEPAQEPEKPPVYDESADAAADIAAALAVAKKENTRVLIQWGANWCGWCKLLHQLFNENRDISRKILYEYEVVYVDVGQFDKNVELAEKFDADFKGNGVPFITILDGDGNVVTNQETGSLEEGSVHDPAKVLGFLTTHQANYLNADDMLSAALAKAREGDKRVFIHSGAPW